MGGNALSKPGVRLDAAEYKKFTADLMDKLVEFNVDQYFEPVKAYFNKPDFGDCDLLCWMPEKKWNGFKLYAADVFEAVETVKNGDVTSYGIQMKDGLFQLDVIQCTGHHSFADVYFSFNDLGNLMGRIAHKMGFKYGHDGLWYVLRDPENDSRVIKEFLVTNNAAKAMDLMGYDWDAYCHGRAGGFQELEDVFKFVTSSPYFTPEIYLLDNRNAKSRVRDSKRKSYMMFLDHCEKMKLPEMGFDWDHLREMKLKEALNRFPAFTVDYLVAIEENKKSVAFKEVYNGDIVAQITGLKGKTLGQFIAFVRNIWSGSDQESFRKSMGAVMRSADRDDWFKAAMVEFEKEQNFGIQSKRD